MTFIIGTPHRRNSGYLDSRSGGEKSTHHEADIQTCPHCQKVIELQKWKDDGGWCGKCNKPVCAGCADRMAYYGCEPFIAQLEKALNLGNKISQFRKLAGLDAPPAVTGVRR